MATATVVTATVVAVATVVIVATALTVVIAATAVDVFAERIVETFVVSFSAIPSAVIQIPHPPCRLTISEEAGDLEAEQALDQRTFSFL